MAAHMHVQSIRVWSLGENAMVVMIQRRVLGELRFCQLVVASWISGRVLNDDAVKELRHLSRTSVAVDTRGRTASAGELATQRAIDQRRRPELVMRENR